MASLRKPVMSAVAFFGTLWMLSVWYSAYTGLSTVTSGQPLTVSMWTQLRDNFAELNSRTSAIASSGGNVGIGTANPSANLEVVGSVKFGGRQISKITVCSFWWTPNSTLTNRFYHYWTAGECDNGLPSWTCLGFITKAWHNGSDQDWEVVFPGEDPGSAGWAATNGGMAWWTASSWAGLGIRATYMCQ